MKTFILCLLITSSAFGHSGRTNSSGCHNDYQNGGYHCHRADETNTKEVNARNPASTEEESTKEEKVPEDSLDLKK